MTRSSPRPSLPVVAVGVVVTVAALALPLALTAPCLDAQEIDSRWPPRLAEIDELLRAGKWRRAGKRAERTARELIRDSWGPRESGGWLAELAFYRAVAAANRDEREEAVWYWHVAQNLDRSIRRRDLTPYASAAKVLLEHPLRARGEAPTGVRAYRRRQRGDDFRPPQVPAVPRSVVQGNARYERERTDASDVEVLIDEEGRLSHPIVLTPELAHPFLTYATLELLRESSPLGPARVHGEPVPVIYTIDLQLDHSRW